MQMSVMTDAEMLRQEMEAVFPVIEMPRHAELCFHPNGCSTCEFLANDLEEFRHKAITADLIRLLHQELSNLSAKATLWILPHYLKFCLPPTAAQSHMEIEFLVYNLGPDLQFQKDTIQRYSLLNSEQIACLVHFLRWLTNDEYWRDYFLDDINRALSFLRTLNQAPIA